jgi:hypothetical protein
MSPPFQIMAARDIYAGVMLMAIWFLGINPDLNGTGTPID